MIKKQKADDKDDILLYDKGEGRFARLCLKETDASYRSAPPLYVKQEFDRKRNPRCLRLCGQIRKEMPYG
jgi:hypothetical protein